MMNEIIDYVEQIDDKRKAAFLEIYHKVKENLPEGFEETFQYNMVSFVVPLSRYSSGYLNRKDEPLPFISLGVQKNHLALYHMGIMGNKDLLAWFEKEYAKVVSTKLNMGKSCIRFTNVKNIPYDLIGELASKITVDEWIDSYEYHTDKKKK